MNKARSSLTSARSSDFLCGCLFVFIGVIAAIFSLNYRLGTSLQLGPGAFPLIVACLLVVVGATQIIKSILTGGEAALQIDVRSISSIVGALVFAGLTVRWLGIIVAIPGAVILSSLASGSARLLPTLLMATFLTAFAYLVFVVGLGIQLSLLPEALQ